MSEALSHVYVIEVDDGFSQNSFYNGIAATLSRAKERVIELYPDAMQYGDDYSFKSGTCIRINIEVWEILK